jgi:hypothetical protein
MSLLSPITFYLSSVDGSFVNFNGGSLAWPQLFQGDTRDLQIGIVMPSGNPNAPYTVVNGNGVTLYVTMGATPKGDGSQTIYAGPLAMVWNPNVLNGTGNANGAWQGSLSLAGANLAAAIGTGASTTATFEINLSTGGIPQGLAQNTITIFAPENPNGNTIPQPAINYLTKAQSDSAYVDKNGGVAGDGFFLISPAGTKRFISLNDDGTISVA